ncbi:MAG: hypothetical protein AAF494_11565 [Pseudomonadota bacterium]
MIDAKPFRLAATGLLASLSLLLTGCFITPGKFTSELELSENGDFTFSYDGEIFFLALANLAKLGAANEQFKPSECYVDATYEVRDCTANEIEGQRAEWEAGAEARAAEAKQQAEQMSAMMGGIDPSDPEAVEELTQLLLRQKGWNRVEAKGDGVFDVSYEVSGTLSHDFMFPVIEGFPTTNPFVQILLRDGDVVRVNAPGFGPQNESNAMGGMLGGMGAMAGLAAMGSPNSSNDKMPEFPMVEGTFRIVAAESASIRANNTDEGPSTGAEGQVLSWDISARSTAAPTALIDLSQ